MSNYYCNFKNETDQTWTMAVYQTLPDSIGLDSVSWKQTTVPHSGFSGVKWEVDYNVATADYQQTGGIGVYTASQVLSSLLGKQWDCVFADNVQQLKEAGNAPQGNQIIINNKSNRLANLGVGMSGQGSLFKKGVLSGASAQFTVTPTYWAGLFNQVQLGQVISSNITVGPLKLEYPNGLNAATVTARLDGDNILLKVEYGSQVSVSQAIIQERIKSYKALLA